MNGWNGFALPGIPGMTGQVGPLSMGNYGAPSAPSPIRADAMDNFFINRDAMSRNFTMPQGAQPAGWMGYNGMSGAGGAIPGVGGTQGNGWFGIQGLGANLDTARLGIGALGSIASIWNASQQNKLAKASFNHQRGILDTNLANQIKSYNLTLDDKLRSRQVVEGTSDAAREEARKRWEARDERRG